MSNKERIELSISGWARETGLDRRTISKILDPIKHDSQDNLAKYWTARGFLEGVRRYYAPEEETTLNDERLRLTKAQADEREIAVAKARGEVIEVEHVAQTLADVMAQIKSNLTNLPPKLAPAVFNSTTAREVEEVAKDIIHAALWRASEAVENLISGGEGADTSSETDDQPVGGDREETEPRGIG